MMSSAWDLIDKAFGEQNELCKRSHEAIAIHPQLEELFGDVSQYIISLRSLPPLQGDQPSRNSKKRKFDGGVNGTDNQYDIWKHGTYSTIKELSFTLPQRKKLNLDIGNAITGLRAKNTTTDEVEFAVNWQDVAQIVCLPVPEKAQAQYNFSIFPINGDGITNASEVGSIKEQILWTVPNTTPKGGLCSDDVSYGTDETYKSIMIRLLNERLRQRKGHSVQIVEPDPTEFVSETAQPYKKGDKAVHVKAFRGNKDGFLFFLPTGVFWGFKKPLVFFSFDAIDSVSYTSVLQRTFNLNISARGSLSNSETQEYEFSMLDQGEFANIDAYIKCHQLQDASMAEQRRAKKLNINGIKGEAPGEDRTDSPGELEKAAQEAGDLDDDEEEEDENFDPGSEGESEGSGTSDEDEDGNEPVGEGNDVEVDDTP